jgi:hypothetical protein
MARVRGVVEWGFTHMILQLWKFLDFQQSAMILKMPMGQFAMGIRSVHIDCQ